MPGPGPEAPDQMRWRMAVRPWISREPVASAPVLRPRAAPRVHAGVCISIYSLMRDGRELAEGLREARAHLPEELAAVDVKDDWEVEEYTPETVTWRLRSAGRADDLLVLQLGSPRITAKALGAAAPGRRSARGRVRVLAEGGPDLGGYAIGGIEVENGCSAGMLPEPGPANDLGGIEATSVRRGVGCPPTSSRPIPSCHLAHERVRNASYWGGAAPPTALVARVRTRVRWRPSLGALR
jgi:hypothetical protein